MTRVTTPFPLLQAVCGQSSLGWLASQGSALMTESRRMVVFQRLGAELGMRLAGEVRFDNAARAAYASDASNYRQVPVGVVLPRTIEDIVAGVALCREHGAAILPRGAGTSMCGQSLN